MKHLQRMNLPPGEQEVALGGAQGFFRCGVKDDQQRLGGFGVFCLLAFFACSFIYSNAL